MRRFPIIMTILLVAVSSCSVKNAKQDICNEMVKTSSSKTALDSIADSVRIYYNYKENKQSYEYTLIDLGAKYCVPCKMMVPVLESIRNEYKQVQVRFIDVMERDNEQWANYFNVDVIPVQIVLDKSGKEVFRHVGYISKEELEEVFNHKSKKQ